MPSGSLNPIPLISTHNALATAHGLTASISAALTAAATPSAGNAMMTASATAAAVNEKLATTPIRIGTLGTPAILEIATDHLTIPWRFKAYSATFSGTRDDVLSIGFNVWPQQTDNTKAATAFQIENDYYDGVQHSSEFIFAWNSPDGAIVRRGWQVNFVYTGQVSHIVDGYVSFYSADGGTKLFYLDDELKRFGALTGSCFVGEYNDQFIKQKSPSGSLKSLIYLGLLGMVHIAADGGGAKIYGNSQLDGTLRVLKTDGLNVLELSGSTLDTYQFGYYIGVGTPNYLYMYTGATIPMCWSDSGLVGVNNYNPTTYFDINGDKMRLRTAKTPASASAAGDAGDICGDSDYIYRCVATNTWKRTPISTWT